jgi:hypothetical protein
MSLSVTTMLLDEREAATVGTATSEVLMVGAVESVPQAAIDATAKALRNLIDRGMKRFLKRK